MNDSSPLYPPQATKLHQHRSSLRAVRFTSAPSWRQSRSGSSVRGRGASGPLSRSVLLLARPKQTSTTRLNSMNEVSRRFDSATFTEGCSAESLGRGIKSVRRVSKESIRKRARLAYVRVARSTATISAVRGYASLT